MPPLHWYTIYMYVIPSYCPSTIILSSNKKLFKDCEIRNVTSKFLSENGISFTLK